MTPTLDNELARRLHRKARAARWEVPEGRFADTLSESVARAFAGGSATREQARTHFDSLHLEDLALACACAEGHEAAWEHFIRQHRPGLYRAAEAIAPGRGRDLADSLYADLFGLEVRDGQRRSLFRYFHGRSALGTWLRAVLAQRLVDRVRTERRLRALPDEESAAPLTADTTTRDPSRARYVAGMQDALTGAVAALAPRARLRLGCYYAQKLTMAQIGRLTGEHEATVSRQLARTRKDLRIAIEDRLRARGLADADVTDCFRSLTADAGSLDLGTLFGADDDRKNPAAPRSTSEDVT